MKKVLIIVYYWPPSGGAGVQRWLKFVKYLPQFGWQPTVITTLNGDYPVLDESLEQEVPAEVNVIRTKTPTLRKFFSKRKGLPYGSLEAKPDDAIFRKAALWYRRNLIVPDARRVWNRFALQAAVDELKSGNYEAIVTSGPPHSTHLAGLKLKRKSGIKWLADFRDPWTKIDYLEKVKRHPFTQRIDKKLERNVIENCDLAIGINRKILQDLGAGKKSVIISNGFDPADFKNIRKVKTDDFQINYFGNITAERTPQIVLKSLNQIFAEIPKVQLNFQGKISEDVKQELLSADINRITHFYPYIPHADMMRKMVNSSLLLLLINKVPDNMGILTGKLYEYLGAQVPILGIGPQNGEAAAILTETDSGKMFDYEDKAGIADFISKHYDLRNKRKDLNNKNKIIKYSRKEQTKRLAEILQNLEKVDLKESL